MSRDFGTISDHEQALIDFLVDEADTELAALAEEVGWTLDQVKRLARAVRLYPSQGL